MDFIERISNEVIICDGAMGTMLFDLGVPKGHCYDELNLSNPEIVRKVHGMYIDSGAEIIETNTFGANYFILEKYYDLGKMVRDINYYGARIAREVAGKERFVAGSVGPITRPLESPERIPISDVRSMFKEQIEALVDGGVDVIVLETMVALDELKEGFFVAKEIKDIPVICQLSFVQDGRTLLGVDPAEAARVLSNAGVNIMGANCGQGPRVVYEAIRRMGHLTHAKLSAQPNAGLPGFVNGKFVYPASPEYFAKYAERYVKSGVSIIGGCCGSTPKHIRAMSERIKGMRPKKRRILTIEKREERREKRVLHPSTSLARKLGHKFCITMELDPPRGINLKKEIEAVKRFKQIGGDAVNISDNPMARLRMSPLPLAHIIKKDLGLDVILHFTTRDRNILAIQSDLIGGYALGIDNILALTGDPPSVGDYPFAAAVFEITSRELVEITTSMNQGFDRLGNPLDEPTSFFVGIAASVENPFVKRIKEKIARGAGFIQTQPVFSLEKLKKFMKIDFGVPVIASILPLVSLRHAEFLNNEVPGINIPEEIMHRMEKNEGLIIAREILNEIKKVCQGVCIMSPFKRYEWVEQILKE